MNCEVKHIGATAVISVKDPKEGASLKASLSLVNRFNGERLILYNDLGAGLLEIPRGLISPGQANILPWRECTIEFKGELRPGQEELVDSYLDHIKVDSGGIISSPTGSGKTVIGIAIMAKLGFKTLIIVPNLILIQQWVDRLKTFSNMTDKDIGVCHGDKCQWEDKKVVVGMIHSLSKEGRYPREFYTAFGLGIWDEIHRLGAPTFAQSATLYSAKYRLGLTATPRRSDGMDKVFFYHVGTICAPAPKHGVKPKIVMLNYRGQDTNHHGCILGGTLSLGMYWNRVARSSSRNKFLTEVIMQPYEKDRHVLVLTDRLSQVWALKGLIKSKGVQDTDIGICVGKQKYGLDRKIILATYGSAGLGMDVPILSALVLATPRADIEQAVGRILRSRTDGVQPVVLDIVDIASSIMVGWSKAREKFYRKVATEVHRI